MDVELDIQKKAWLNEKGINERANSQINATKAICQNHRHDKQKPGRLL